MLAPQKQNPQALGAWGFLPCELRPLRAHGGVGGLRIRRSYGGH